MGLFEHRVVGFLRHLDVLFHAHGVQLGDILVPFGHILFAEDEQRNVFVDVVGDELLQLGVCLLYTSDVPTILRV